MVNIGTLSIGIEVRGIRRAQKQTENLKESVDGLAQTQTGEFVEDTQRMEQGMNEVTESTAETEEQVSRYNQVMGILNTIQGYAVEGLQRLSSWMGLSAGRTQMLTGAVVRLKTAFLGLATSIKASIIALGGYVKALASAILGSTSALLAIGASIGAIIGGGIVRALQNIGFMDWVGDLGSSISQFLGTDLVAGLLALLTPLLGTLTTIGAFIDGFIANIEHGFGTAIARGIDQAVQSLTIFKNAIQRTVNNLLTPFNMFMDLVNSVIDSIERVSGMSLPDLPNVDIQLPNVPSLDVGGRIESDGIAEVHKGEHIIPTEDIPDEAPTSDGGSDQTSGGDVTVERVQVTVNMEQTLDGNLRRRDIKKLAEEIADVFGDELKKELPV